MSTATSFSVLALPPDSLDRGPCAAGTVSAVPTFALAGRVAAAPQTGAIHHPGGETPKPSEKAEPCLSPAFPPAQLTAHLPTACPAPGVLLNAEYLFVKGRVQYSLEYVLVGL